MATSGSFNTPQFRDYFSLKFEWTLKSQSVEKNSSVISWSLKGETPSWITGMVTCGYFTITINGTVVYSTGRYDRVNVYNKTVVATGEATIPHSNDGSKTFGVDIKAAVYDGEVNTTAYAEFSLPEIARASIPTLSANSVNFGSAVTVNTNRKASSFTHALYYSINGGAQVKITDNIGASYKWTVPYSLMSSIPNAKSATIVLTLYTYNGATEVGSNTVSVTANVPNNSTTRPSVTLNSLIPVSSLPAEFSSLYVQGKSKVQADVDSSGQYGATVRSCVMTVDGVAYGSAQNYTSGYLTSYGEKTVTITATDSRGITNSVSQTISVIAYSSPKINVALCDRCNADGDVDDAGTYLKIQAKRTYSPVISDEVQNNYCRIDFRYKAAGTESFSGWATILDAASQNDEVLTGALLDGSLLVSRSYVVEVRAIDTVGEFALSEIPVLTERVYWHRDGANRSFCFGGYAEEPNTFVIENDIMFKAKGGVNGFVESTNFPGCYYRLVNGVEEWINPPMQPNIEYRTTARFNGEARYKKIVTYVFADGLSGVANYTIPHGISNFKGIISITAFTDGYVLPWVTANSSVAVGGCDIDDITLVVNNSVWGENRIWYFELEYTKTT